MPRFVKLLSFLEHPDHPCLGPNMKLLSLFGIWHPDTKSPNTRAKLALFYINISFFISQYVKCLIRFDSDSLKLILQYAPFHIGVVKTCLFQAKYKKWERLIKFVSSEELHQISRNDKNQTGILDDYINRSRRVTYFFWTLALFSNFGIFSEPYQKSQISENGTNVYVYLFDGYTPFAEEPPGYYFTMVIQTVMGNVMSVYVVTWDMLVVSIMIFFAGQLRMSKLYCKRVVDFQNVENSHRNIAECHRFHTTLIHYQKEFNDLISPVMFVYLVVICVNLGVCILQIAEIKDDVTRIISGCFFIMACLIQLLLFYWHGNEVTVESETVKYSTFKSDWVYADKSVQKEILLLGLATSKMLIFTAGPFTEMSLTTFISILRSSYSFYTLLKGTNE